MKPTTLLLLLTGIACTCRPLSAQTIDRSIYTTDGPVYTTAQKGDTLYIGGNFTQSGYGVKRLARFEPNSTKPDFSFAELGGASIYAVEPDGNGGYYLGGIIHSYAGLQLRNRYSAGVIHILADNSLDPHFTPTDLNDTYNVTCLKKHGDRLYIGGVFWTVNGVNHKNLAALDATTGRVLNWFPDEPDGIDKMEASDSLLFIQGSFYNVGEHSATNFAALKASNGKYVRYYSADRITGIQVHDNKLYIGGDFSSIGYTARGLAKVDASTAEADKQFPEINNDGYIKAIIPDSKGGYYIGGSFSQVGNVARTNIAHILPDGSVDPGFKHYLDGEVSCFETDGTSLYFGGYFTRVNNITRRHAAAILLSTGELTRWNPDPDGIVSTMVHASGKIYIGGSFQFVKGQHRNNAAAVTVSNQLTNWAPEPNAPVHKIITTPSGSTLFIAGEFSRIDHKARPFLARVNNSDGSVAAWNPQPGSYVYDMALNGSNLFIGGAFQSVHGIERLHLAEIDTAVNHPTNFKADASDEVDMLAIYGGKLYVGGTFYYLRDRKINNCARIDLTTRTVDEWRPEPTYYVSALVADNNHVIMGGAFSNINETKRTFITAINLAENKITSFNPKVNAFSGNSGGIAISIFAFRGNELFAGGAFTYDNENGTGHYGNIISLDTLTGLVTRYFDYSPNIFFGYSTTISGLAVSKNQLYVGGSFNSLFDSSGTQSIERYNLISYDLNNNRLTSNIYNPNEAVSSLHTDKLHRIIVSGAFTLTSFVNRRNLAAINLTTGVATNWHPVADGNVNALAVKDTLVFAGGEFTKIYDSTDYSTYTDRLYLAAISTKTGKPATWNADADNYIRTLALDGSTLYAGGYFNTIKGINRNYAAAIGTEEPGTIKSWAPNPDNVVVAILPVGNKVYISGGFTQVGGVAQNYLASVNNNTGALNSWNPNPNSGVSTLTTNGTTLYVGGDFTTISNQPRQSIAAYTITANTLTLFDPQLKNQHGTSPSLSALASYGKKLFMASYGYDYGTIDSIKGKPRHILGAADTINSEATAFNPQPDNDINCLAIYGNRLITGGAYTSLGVSLSASYFNVFNLAPIKEPVLSASSDSVLNSTIIKSSVVNPYTNTKQLETFNVVITPNPVKDRATLNITGTVNRVSITLSDLSGKLLWQVISEKEKHINIPVEKLAQGMYLVQVNSGNQSKVIKLMKE